MAASIKRTRPAVTAQWIARQVGLGRSTVSHVLNRRGDELGIRPETQRRILELAEKYHYSPNPLAKGLVGGRTMSVGMLWSLGGPHDSEGMARRVTQEFQQHGYTTYLADRTTNRDALTALRDFAQRRVDAVVIQDLAGTLTADPQVIPVLDRFAAVTVVSALQLKVRWDLIVQDRACAMRQAALHLWRIARRTRPIIIAPLESDRIKIEAFAQVYQQEGSPIDPEHMIDVRHGQATIPIQPLFDAMEKRFARQVSSFDAAWCSSDEEAVGLIDWLRQRGKRVPEDVAVVGFNDNVMSAHLSPRLASVHRYDETVVQHIGELVMQRLREPNLPSQRRHVEMEFVHRESAG